MLLVALGKQFERLHQINVLATVFEYLHHNGGVLVICLQVEPSQILKPLFLEGTVVCYVLLDWIVKHPIRKVM